MKVPKNRASAARSRVTRAHAAARKIFDTGGGDPLTDAIFRDAIDSSPDLIFIVDVASMRFLYVNDTACRLEGCSREEYLRRTPMEVTHTEREELERLYREAIAKGDEGVTTEFGAVSRDGRRGWFEAHRRALNIAGRWIIVTITRDAARRRLAEKAARRQSRMYATLSATNEIIMRALSPAELYQQVCDAAVHGGKFITTAVIVPDLDQRARVAAVSGQQQLRHARISLDASTPHGQGIIGIAFRTRRTNISNDFLNDPRTRPWHKHAARLGIAASAAVPLVRDDGALGVLLFHSADKRAFDSEVVGLLERMAQDIVFALENFKRDAERQFTRMYATLSATNEAITRATSPNELFQQICSAAVDAGKFSSTFVFLVQPDSERLAFAAGAGAGLTAAEALRISTDPDRPEGRGLVAPVIRTREPNICNDLEAEAPARTDTPEQTAAGAGAAFPIHRGERTIGAIVFYSPERGAFDAEIARLLERMSANISFALDNFDHETERRQTEAALRTSEEKHRAILEGMYEGYWEVDLAGNFTYFNDAQCRILGYERAEMMGLNYRRYYDDEQIKRVYEIFNRVYRTGESERLTEWRYRRKDGKLAILESSVQLIRNTSGEPAGFRGITRDITSRHEAEMALRESEARFRALTDLSSDWYWELDADMRLTRIEGRNTAIGTRSHGRYLGRTPWDIGFETNGGWDEHRETLERRQPFRDLLHYRTLKDGTRRYYATSGEPVFDAAGTFLGYRGVGRDITAKILAEERIQYLATHDELTNIPNRAMFGQMLNHAIESARRYQRRFAVLFIDLDRFKFINDTLGHEAGDVLLRDIGRRLSHTLRASDIVARFGGDEFVVLLPEINDATEAGAVARKILAALIAPAYVGGQECRVTASIGISTYPADAQDQQSLIRNADMAMYLAKQEGKNNYQFYSQKIRSEARERLQLEAALRRALDHGEFFLHYQPKVDLRTGTVTGVEALLRWHHSDLGSVSPARFIPLAEETGLIVPIGRWALRSACYQGMAWQQQGLAPVSVAVNLSARQFGDPNLLSDIAAALADSGLPPQCLELEITEGMVMQNPQRAIEILNRVRQMGMHLAIDDFGTGYSSLAQLKRFPINTLKIDRSFIGDIPRDHEDVAITEAIIAMAKTLSLTVVAEGVETAAQKEFLLEHGCDEMQGYYFSKPIGPAEFAALLAKHTFGASGG